jgi:hypothetical protein
MQRTTKPSPQSFGHRFPGLVPISRPQALALAQKWGLAVVVPNTWDRFDIALPCGITTNADTLEDVKADLRERGLTSFLALNADGVEEQYSTAQAARATNIQCGLCEGSGERSKWDVCPECDGRCEKLYQDGYDGGGWPIWVSQTCRSCNGAGGAEHVYQCGFCSGAGFVECAESALMASDTIIQKELVAA